MEGTLLRRGKIDTPFSARKAFATAALCVTLSIACGCLSHQRRAVLHVAPTANLTISDTIDALDFAVQGGGTIHLAYEVVRRNDLDEPTKRELWYERGNLRTNAWSPPKLLDSGEISEPRVALFGSTVLISYLDRSTPKIQTSYDLGITWRHLASPLPTGETTGAYDLGVITTGPVLAYLGDIRDEDGIRTGHQRLALAEGDRRTVTTIVPELKSLRVDPPPRLLVDRASLAVVYCIVESSGQPSAGLIGGPTQSRIFVVRSTDGGRTWGAPAEVQGDRPTTAVVALGAIQTQEAFYIYAVDDVKVRGFRVEGDQCTELDNLTGRRSEGEFARDVTGGSSEGYGHLTWVDSRNAKKDLLTPFSDQPYWLNNDAFCARVGRDGRASESRIQLTTTGGYVRTIQSKGLERSVLAVWGWRPKVGRTEKAYGEKYIISYATVTPQ